MADVEIKGRISVDTSSSGKSLAELNAEIKKTKEVLNDAKIGSKEYAAAQSLLQQQQHNLKQVTEAANQTHHNSGQAFGALKERVTALVPGLKAAESGTSMFGNALKILSANPIILILTGIVTVLKWLYEAFTSTREGAEKVEAVFTGITAVVGAVVDRVMKLGSAIIKFFKGDYRGAVEDAKGAITGLGDEIEQVYTKTVELKRRLQQIKKEEMADELDKSFRQKRLAQLKEMMNDEEVSAREKLRIAKELRDDAIKNAAGDLDRTKRKIEAEIALITMRANWEKDKLEEVNKLKIQLNEVETENALEVVRVNKQVRAAQRQVDAEDKARADEAKARAREAAQRAKEHADKMKAIAKERHDALMKLAELRKKGLQDEIRDMEAFGEALNKEEERQRAAETKRLFDNEKQRLQNNKKLAELDLLNNPKSAENKIAKIKADLELELQTLAEGDIQRQILAKRASDEIVKIKQDEVNAKMQLDEAEYQSKVKLTSAVGSILANLSNLVGNQTAVGKGLAVAASLIDTYSAITATLKNAAKSPAGAIPGYAIAQAISTGIAGFAAVRNILKVQVPNSGGGGGGASIPGNISAVPAPLAPQAASTALNQSSINAVGNAAQGGVNRNFILDADIVNNRERAARINRAARLG